ncbi:MAG TPA: S66 peptidase family protein [Pseudonocardiaceae bacterium]
MVTGYGVSAVNRRGLKFARAMAPGTALGIWTPSSPAPALFPRRYQRSIAALRASGFEAITAPSTERSTGLVAAPPAELAQDLHQLLTDDRIGAVLCATGGYTSCAVLDHVDWGLVRDAAKPVIGYSDVTSVLWSVLSQAGLVCLHGPMLISEWGEWGGPLDYTLTHFRTALSPDPPTDALSAPDSWTDETLRWEREDTRPRRFATQGRWRCLVPGRAEGWLLPGCAATVSHLFGTPYLPDVRGALLCLEFHDTGPDEFWAHLRQWESSGLLDRIAGLVIGRHFAPRQAAAGSGDFDAVVRHVVGDRGFPVLVDVDFGHTAPMLTLPVGGHALLDATGCRLTLLEPATNLTPRSRS